MLHRHITSEGWTLMAIESLFDRGGLADWRELSDAIRTDRQAKERLAAVCRYREPDGAERIAMALMVESPMPDSPVLREKTSRQRD